MTTLVLARHGETVWHAENRYAGRTDVALTDRGRAQAAQLGQWAQVTQPTAVASSDLSRAVRTASPAAEALGLPLIVDPRMREVDFGDGEGLTTAEMRVRFPEALRRFHDHPATSPFPAGERGVDAVDRAWPALDALAEEYSGGTVLVVMHSTLLRLVLCRVLGVDLDRYRTLLPKVHNVALTSILWEDRKGLLSFNAPS